MSSQIHGTPHEPLAPESREPVEEPVAVQCIGCGAGDLQETVERSFVRLAQGYIDSRIDQRGIDVGRVRKYRSNAARSVWRVA